MRKFALSYLVSIVMLGLVHMFMIEVAQRVWTFTFDDSVYTWAFFTICVAAVFMANGIKEYIYD